MTGIRQRIIDENLQLFAACIFYYDEFDEECINYIVEKEPATAAAYITNHHLLTAKHVTYISRLDPICAVKYLSHRLSEEDIAWLAKNHPNYLKEIFK